MRTQDTGSCFDEIAGLMEEMVARVVEHEAKPPRPTQRDLQYQREQALVKSAFARRMASYSASKNGEG